MFSPISIFGLLASLVPTGPVSWAFGAHNQEDGAVVVEMKATVQEGWHIYAVQLPSDQGPIATSFRFDPSTDYEATGVVQEPAPAEEYDPNFAMLVRHHSGAPLFTLAIKPLVQGSFVVQGEVEYMVCNDRTCLPPVAVPFKITVTPTGVK